MSEDESLNNNEQFSIIPIEEDLTPHEPVLINPDFPLREGDDFNVLAEIQMSRSYKDDPRSRSHHSNSDTDEFIIVDLESAPGDEHGNKWFQGSLVHSSTRYLLVDADLDKVDMQRAQGFKGIRENETVTIGRDDEVAVSRFKLSEFVSRDHFSVTLLENGELEIQDNNSSNGTRIRFGTQNHEGIDDITHDKNPQSSENLHSIVEVGEVLEGKKNPCEDTILNEPGSNLYGIFDGVGGHGSGDVASRLASEKSTEYMTSLASDSSPDEVRKGLTEALKAASTTVSREASGGLTTGTIAKIGEDNGQKYIAWASVGDSPIMIFNRDSGSLTRISVDEVLSPDQANVITNAIGNQYMDVLQNGVIQMQQGDEIIICSDGITGDFPPDILTDSEIIKAMQSSDNPQEAARALLRVSRKSDDKAVLVLK